MEAAEMNRLCTLPSAREQARHALLLLGAPAPARLVVGVHHALFDGDLDMSALTGLLRDERRSLPPVVCHGLGADLAPIHVALGEWPLARRIVTPATARADALTFVVRVADLVATHRGAGRSADLFLRELAAEVPGGAEAVDVGDAARAALADPELLAAVEAESPVRDATAVRAARLDEIQQYFGVPAVPQQRGHG
jgi:hypothetical protein